MIDFETKKVLFIDLDSTLIKTISGKTFPEDITDFRIQLPVLNKIVEKFPKLNYLFIVTNQGGIGKFITKSDFERKLDYIQHFCEFFLEERLENMYCCDSEYCDSMDKANPCRKPNTGMLEVLFERWEIPSKEVCIMIGDASGKPGDFSDSDKKCAENFGIDYIDVRDFLEL